MTTICVFCASSEAVPEEFRAIARGLGSAIATRNWDLMYGGGNIGLMGEVARAALAGGSHVTGVIPHLLADREVALEEVSNLVRTETMRERKALMDEGSDAFIVLPGGIGTLEELVEILTLRQLGYHDRPIVLLDPTGYWDPLVEMLRRMVAQGLASGELLELFHHADTVDQALDLAEHPPAHRHVAATEALTLESFEALE